MFVFVGIVFFRMEKLSHFMRMDGNSEMMSGETVWGPWTVADRFFLLLEALEPCFQVHHHLFVIAEADLAAPAMTAAGIDME